MKKKKKNRIESDGTSSEKSQIQIFEVFECLRCIAELPIELENHAESVSFR